VEATSWLVCVERSRCPDVARTPHVCHRKLCRGPRGESATCGGVCQQCTAARERDVSPCTPFHGGQARAALALAVMASADDHGLFTLSVQWRTLSSPCSSIAHCFASSARQQDDVAAQAPAEGEGVPGVSIMQLTGRERTVRTEPHPGTCWRNDPYCRWTRARGDGDEIACGSRRP
jgi:hypothetical protein